MHGREGRLPRKLADMPVGWPCLQTGRKARKWAKGRETAGRASRQVGREAGRLGSREAGHRPVAGQADGQADRQAGRNNITHGK